jgi:hypothetical protein
MEEAKNLDNKTNRKEFLKKSLFAGSVLAAGAVGLNHLISCEKNAGEKIKVLTPDGQLVEVDSNYLNKSPACCAAPTKEARMGVP